MANPLEVCRNKQCFPQGCSQQLLLTIFLLVRQRGRRGRVEWLPEANVVAWIEQPVHQHRQVGIHESIVPCLLYGDPKIVLQTIRCVFEACVRERFLRHRTYLKKEAGYRCLYVHYA